MLLQTGFQPLVLVCILYHHGVMSVGLVEIFTYAFENVEWHVHGVLSRSAHGHHPVVYGFILDGFEVLWGKAEQYLLQRSRHVAEEAHANELYEHLEEVLFSGVTFDISVTDR